MSTTVVDAEFRLRLQSLKKELESVPGMSKTSARKAVKEWTDQWKKAEAESVSTIERIKAESGQLGKAAELIGGPLGTSLRQIKGLGEIAADGVNATTLALGGAAIGIGVIAGLGKAFYDVASNVEAYRGELNRLHAEGTISSQDIADVEKAGRALEALTERGRLLYTEIAVNLSGGFDEFATGLVYVTSLVTTLSFDGARESAKSFHEEINQLNEDLTKSVPNWMTQLPGNKPVSQLVSVDDVKAAEEAARKAQAAAAKHRAAWDKQFADAVQADKDVQDLFAELDASITAQQQAIADAAVADLMAEAQAAQDAASIIMQAKHDELEQTKQANAEMQASEKALAAERVAKAQQYLGAVSSVMASVADIADTMTQRQVDAARDGSEEQKKALKRQFAVHKAAALAQAAIYTASAVVGALATIPGPGGIALAVIEGALGAVQIGLIAAQQPQIAHTGSMVRGSNRAPDEVPITALEGEGILNREAVRRMGGPEGVNRANRGQTSSNREPIVVPVYGHRVFDAVSGNAMTRVNSPIARAVRSVRSTRAGHRAYAGQA